MTSIGNKDDAVAVLPAQDIKDLGTGTQQGIKNDNVGSSNNDETDASAPDPELGPVEEPRGKFRILAIMLALSVS
jgi:hypothetical protein